MTEDHAAENIAALIDRCSNIGRWGPDDALGTLNLITPETRRRAVALVGAGEVVPLGRRLANGTDVALELITEVVEGATVSVGDMLTIQQHGFTITHFDALGHSFLNGRAFGGLSIAEVIGPHGLRHAAVTAVAATGVVTRGILLDVAAARGVDHLEAGDRVGAADLAAAEARAALTVGAGDAVFVRTGLARRVAAGSLDTPDLREGLAVDAIPWLRERDIAVYSGDCIERLPSEIPGLPLPLHQIGMVAMGLWFLDNPDLEVLREACDRHGTNAFALVIAPLAIEGATGSPINPLALF